MVRDSPRNYSYTNTLATMSEKPMNRILIIFLIIGLYSCGDKQKSEKKTETVAVEKTVPELKDFEFLQDFEIIIRLFKLIVWKSSGDQTIAQGCSF